MTAEQNPPLANRGVLITNTEELELTSMIDYLRISFKTNDYESVIEQVLQLDITFMQELDTAFYGYHGTFKLDHIKVMHCPPDGKANNRGVLIELSGQGCRELEIILNAQKRTWLSFLKDCVFFGAKFPRVDFAIDDRRTYFNIPDLYKKLENGEAISKFRSIEYNGSLRIDNGSPGGMSIYFGSKKSEVYMVFYEKNYEQAKKFNMDLEDIGLWNRYEVRLMNERAENAIYELLDRGDLMYVSKSVIFNYLRFAEKREDVHRQHWKTQKFWEEFIGGVGKLKLFASPADGFYQKTKNWFENSVAPSAAVIQTVDFVNGTTWLQDTIDNAVLQPKHKHMIEVWNADIQDMIVKPVKVMAL